MPNPWAGSNVGAVPITQINSLPVLTVSQFTDGAAGGGADGVIYSGHVLKFWSPTVLGIVASAPALTGTKYHITTPWLDVSPCQFFVFTIKRAIPLGDNVAAKACNLMVQYKQDAADAPPVTMLIGAAINDEFNGIYPLRTNAITFPAIVGPATARYTIGICPNTGVASTMTNVSLVIGPWVRFQLSWSTNAPDAGDHSTYSMSIIGSS